MALTRAMLKGMGLTEEQVSAIIEEHTNVTQALKDQIKEYKADAEKLPTVQAELEALKNSKGDDWEKKYTEEHNAFEEYKTQVAAQEKLNAVRAEYKKLLVDSKVGDKHIDAILRVTDFSKMELKDGKFANESDLREAIKTEWSGFITTSGTQGADVDTPPAGNDSMTKEAFNKLSLSERMSYANAHPAEAAEFLK